MPATPPRARRKGPALLGLLLAVNVVAFSAVLSTGVASAGTSPNLGTAASASVVGHSTVTNTGPSILAKDLDLSPGTSAPGFTGPPNGLVLGAQHLADGVALQAQSDFWIAYGVAKGAPSTKDETNKDLGNQNLTAGVYTSASSMQLTGTLTLTGGPSSVFIFQAVSGLNTAPSATVHLTGGVEACNIWWQVGSSATLNTGNTFVGNILASTSVSLAHGTTIDGRAMAHTGAVTLDDNVFTNSLCATPGVIPTPTTTLAPATTAPPRATTVPGAGATLPASGTTVPATTATTSALPGSPLAYTAAATTTTGPAVVGPPKTGGGPLRSPASPWLPILVVSLIASAFVASGLGLAAWRRTQPAGR